MDFEDYLNKISSISDSAVQSQQFSPVARSLIMTYVNEARYGYNLIKPHLDKDKRILEVGAGVGILSAYLHLCGYQIVAIEPSGTGFDLNNQIGQQLKQSLQLKDFDFLDIGVEDLHRSLVGEVDIIYSVNVVEHLPDLNIAFARMQSVLSPQGLMIHTCPNYHVPYEPHFAIPLIPLFPSATRHLLAIKIATSELWKSFNFVTSSKLKGVARRHGLKIDFEPGTMYQSLRRLGEDPVFAERHRGLIAWTYRFLTSTKLIGLLRYWPAMLSTPMNFTCRHKA